MREMRKRGKEKGMIREMENEGGRERREMNER